MSSRHDCSKRHVCGDGCTYVKPCVQINLQCAQRHAMFANSGNPASESTGKPRILMTWNPFFAREEAADQTWGRLDHTLQPCKATKSITMAIGSRHACFQPCAWPGPIVRHRQDDRQKFLHVLAGCHLINQIMFTPITCPTATFGSCWARMHFVGFGANERRSMQHMKLWMAARILTQSPAETKWCPFQDRVRAVCYCQASIMKAGRNSQPALCKVVCLEASFSLRLWPRNPLHTLKSLLCSLCQEYMENELTIDQSQRILLTCP